MNELEHSGQPLVSVIIPTYNYGKFVLSAIDSVKKQDYPNIEIIVIDDGSTDNTQQLLADLPKIVYVRQENQGLSSARNHGVHLAKGKYLQFLDADDLLPPTSIHKRVTFLEHEPCKSAVICRSVFFHNPALTNIPLIRFQEWCQPESDSIDLALYFFNIAPPHAFLIRKSVVDKFSLKFDTSLCACEDYDFWFRLAQVSGAPGLVKSCWVYYRQHANSMSRSYKNQYQHDAELCKRIYASVNATEPWIGNHPRFDYLFAMLAASLITARRLWFFDRESFNVFMQEHIFPLLQEIKKEKYKSTTNSTTLVFISRARLTLLKMRNNDKSLDQPIYNSIICIFPKNPTYLTLVIKKGVKHISIKNLARLAKFDLQFIYLRLINKIAMFHQSVRLGSI
jgi:glycosyltransferase involved in cell wall biosynthesis